MQWRTICVQSCSRALTSVRPAGVANVAWLARVASIVAVPIEIVAHRDPSRRAAVAVAACVLEWPKVRSIVGAAMPQLNVPTYCMVMRYADWSVAVPS